MKVSTHGFFLFATVLGASSCSSLPPTHEGSSSLPEMRNSLQDSMPIFTEQDIEHLATIQPQVEVPFRLGIAPPLEVDTSYSRWSKPAPSVGTWSPEEREHLELWAAEMQSAGILSEVVFLPGLLVDHRNEDEPQSFLHSIRSAGARNHVETVLVVRVVSRASSRSNALALLYLTLIGGFFVPGTDVHCRTLVEGALVDVGNEYLYSVQEAQAEETASIAPVFERDRAEVQLERTRLEALEALTAEFENEAVRLGLLPTSDAAE